MTELITSRENPAVKSFCALLSQKKERDATGLFACEGARLCTDALESGLAPRLVLLTERAARRYPEAAGRLTAAGTETRFLSEELAGRISDTRSPQGIFAVFKKLDNEASAVTIGRDGKYLLAAGVQDPGNLGTILRTAEAFGVTGVLLDESCPDLYSPKVLRAAMGGVFRLRLCRVPDMAEAVGHLRAGGVAVYAAALTDSAVSLADAPPMGAVLIGNEGAGLPEALIACCDGSVMIPMAGGAESLNAATAASILIWEMMKKAY